MFARAGGLRGSRFGRYAAEFMGVEAVLEAAGFGFGKQGSKAGAFYDYDAVAPRTPSLADTGINMRSLS